MFSCLVHCCFRHGPNLIQYSQVPRLPWMSVGRTNPLRAGFFSSGASSSKNVAFTPPYNIHNWIPLHVTWPRASPKLLKFNSSRSYGRFRCASSLSTRAHPVCPLITDDFFLKLYFSVSDLGFVPLWILWCLFNIWSILLMFIHIMITLVTLEEIWVSVTFWTVFEKKCLLILVSQDLSHTSVWRWRWE